jgi:diguanylate cyclase (GGDEF)-like protein
MVSRFGGDEFLALLTGLSDERQALEVATRIREAVAQPIHVNGTDVAVGCSIGVAVHSLGIELDDAATLIHNADLAMHHAKHSGHNGVEYFDPSMAAA